MEIKLWTHKWQFITHPLKWAVEKKWVFGEKNECLTQSIIWYFDDQIYSRLPASGSFIEYAKQQIT